MNTETRNPIRLLALMVALGTGFALSACQPSEPPAEAGAMAEEQAAAPAAEPTPAQPSEVQGESATAPAADATNSAPIDDAAMPPPADAAPATAEPADAQEPQPDADKSEDK